MNPARIGRRPESAVLCLARMSRCRRHRRAATLRVDRRIPAERLPGGEARRIRGVCGSRECRPGTIGVVHTTPALVSIGYEGRDVPDLIAELAAQNVHVLVDVRLTPISRKPGLSKRRLAAELARAGIAYVHHRELGNPKDNRVGFRAGERTSLERFRQILQGSAAESALHHVSQLLDGGAVALLCFERDHADCHRGLVAEALLGSDPSVRMVAV